MATCSKLLPDSWMRVAPVTVAAVEQYETMVRDGEVPPPPSY